MIKIYLDVETTGTEPQKHSIHQIAGIVEVEEVVLEEFDYKVAPHPKCICDPASMTFLGVTEEQIRAYPEMKEVHKKFTKLLGKYVDKYDKKDKATIVGYNNRSFDEPFLRKWFEQCGDNYFGSWFWPNSLDALVLATEYLAERRIDMPSFKLFRVALELGLEVDKEKTHEAGYDIALTRQIYRIVTGREIEI